MRKKKEQEPKEHADVAPEIEPEAEPLAEMPAEPRSRQPHPAHQGRWRVAREALANINGSFTRLTEGQVLDPLGYSAATIESLLAQGVALEPAE